jgi:hypothetical protein
MDPEASSQIPETSGILHDQATPATPGNTEDGNEFQILTHGITTLYQILMSSKYLRNTGR